MRYFGLISILALILIVIYVAPVKGGEPIGEIGPMNPTMFRCVEPETREEIIGFIQPDPFSKRLIPIVRIGPTGGEVEVPLAELEDFLEENPEAREQTCTNDIEIDFGFDTTDAAAFRGYLNDLENQCEDEGGELEPITDTRIEGYVYEFHPDINNPGKWFAVPSQDVPVVARGITFEITWGTDSNGFFYFPNLGAGPIVLNLGPLPPDAHPLNTNVIIFSTGLDEPAQPIVALGFYRGDMSPPDINGLTLPDGTGLTIGNFEDLQSLARCGYTGMPNVGGVLRQERPVSVVTLGAILLILLPVVGLLKIYQGRSK